jgi:uncharacterized protein YbcI
MAAVSKSPAAPSAAENGAHSGPVLAELSRRLVQVLRREVGRGPTQAKTYWAGDDLLVTLFGDVFLRSEKTLLTHGQEDVAMAYRGAIQHALRQELRAEVERVVGRKVVAAMGCAHHEPDLMAELFVFEPQGRFDRPGGTPPNEEDAGRRPASSAPSSQDGSLV